MTNELKAAAERVGESLRMAEEGVVEKVALDITYGGDMDGFKRDMQTLSDGSLARLAADEQQAKEDAEPITEEWLRSFMDQEYEGTFSNRSMMLGCICEECGRYGWCWIIGNVHIVHLQTRGQLRKLLEALKGST